MVSIVSGIPLFYDWLPYHYGVFQRLMVLFQPIFNGCNPTFPPIGILITLRYFVPGLCSIQRRIKNTMTQYTKSNMCTCDYFLIRLQISNGNSYRNEQRTYHQGTDQIGAYVASFETLETIFHKGIRY